MRIAACGSILHGNLLFARYSLAGIFARIRFEMGGVSLDAELPVIDPCQSRGSIKKVLVLWFLTHMR
jgi:hypothetical protein